MHEGNAAGNQATRTPSNTVATAHLFVLPGARCALALYEESKRKSDEWVKLCPPTDYGAIVDHLRELRRRKAAG